MKFRWTVQAQEDPVVVNAIANHVGGASLTLHQLKNDRGFACQLSRVELFETIRRLQELYRAGDSR